MFQDGTLIRPVFLIFSCEYFLSVFRAKSGICGRGYKIKPKSIGVMRTPFKFSLDIILISSHLTSSETVDFEVFFEGAQGFYQTFSLEIIMTM